MHVLITYNVAVISPLRYLFQHLIILARLLDLLLRHSDNIVIIISPDGGRVAHLRMKMKADELVYN